MVVEWTETGNIKQGWDKMVVWSLLALCTVKYTTVYKTWEKLGELQDRIVVMGTLSAMWRKLLPCLLSSYTLKGSKIAFMLEFWGWIFTADSSEQGLKQEFAQEASLQPEKAKIALFSDQQWNQFDTLYILMQLQTAVE